MATSSHTPAPAVARPQPDESWFSGGVAFAIWGTILAVALGFRLWGLDWGQKLDINPDEALVLEIASGLSLQNPNPHFFSYCGFIFNQSILTVELFKLFGVELVDFSRLIMHRLWSVFWGVGTVVLVFHIVRAMGGSRRAGALGAGLMAILPLHVWESHFGTTDSPLLFFMMASLLASLRLYDRPSLLHAALPGLFAGFAVGTKYPGAFGVFPFAAAMFFLLRERRLVGWRPAVDWTLASGAAAVAAAFLVSPFSFLEYMGTFEAFWYEYDTVGSGHFGFDLNVPGWQYHPYIYEIFAGFPFGFGIALWPLIVAALVFSFRRPAPRVIITLVYVTLFFVITGRWLFVPVRYFMPMFPALIALTGLFLDWLLRNHRRVGVAVGAVVAVYTLAFTATSTHRFVTDTRIQATEWVNRELPAGSTIILTHARMDESYTASFDRARFPFVGRQSLQYLDNAAERFAQELAESGPPGAGVYLSVSSLDYDRYYRTQEPESVEAWDWIRKNPERFRLVKSFDTWFLNKRFYMSLDPMFGGYFVSPHLEFYEYIPESARTAR